MRPKHSTGPPIFVMKILKRNDGSTRPSQWLMREGVVGTLVGLSKSRSSFAPPDRDCWGTLVAVGDSCPMRIRATTCTHLTWRSMATIEPPLVFGPQNPLCHYYYAHALRPAGKSRGAVQPGNLLRPPRSVTLRQRKTFFLARNRVCPRYKETTSPCRSRAMHLRRNSPPLSATPPAELPP